MYFRVPEPSGRSFAELDLLFQQGVSARQFATTRVNVFEEDIDGDFMRQYHRSTKVKAEENLNPSDPRGSVKPT